VSRYRFIEAEKVHHAVATLCRVLKVSRAAYYIWSKHMPSVRAVADQQLAQRIKALHAETNDCYGAPRMHRELRNLDIPVARKRVARLMRLQGLSGWTRRRYVGKPTVLPFPALPDLVQRQFTPSAINQLWIADITYIRTWEGWLYLAVVMDCFSRKIVGWSMTNHLRTKLVTEALEMAVAHRKPPAGAIFQRPRLPTQVHGLRQGAARLRPRTECGAPGNLLGQHRGGELLRHLEEGAHLPTHMATA
jgi:putative transposase